MFMLQFQDSDPFAWPLSGTRLQIYEQSAQYASISLLRTRRLLPSISPSTSMSRFHGRAFTSSRQPVGHRFVTRIRTAGIGKSSAVCLNCELHHQIPGAGSRYFYIFFPSLRGRRLGLPLLGASFGCCADRLTMLPLL